MTRLAFAPGLACWLALCACQPYGAQHSKRVFVDAGVDASEQEPSDAGLPLAPAAKDAAANRDFDAGATVMDAEACGPCFDRVLENGTQLRACCTAEHECGYLGPVWLGNQQPQLGTSCYTWRDVGELSPHCGAYFDERDLGPMDRSLTLPEAPTCDGSHPVRLVPCCTPRGECGVVLDAVSGTHLHQDSELGCVGESELSALTSLGVCMLPANESLATFNACQPSDGSAACPPQLGTLGCAQLEELGAAHCDAARPTPDWFCAMLDLPRIDEREPPQVSRCMEDLPAQVHGCGAHVTYDPMRHDLPCVSNVNADIAGCSTDVGVHLR